MSEAISGSCSNGKRIRTQKSPGHRSGAFRLPVFRGFVFDKSRRYRYNKATVLLPGFLSVDRTPNEQKRRMQHVVSFRVLHFSFFYHIRPAFCRRSKARYARDLTVSVASKPRISAISSHGIPHEKCRFVITKAELFVFRRSL